jgi:hypothetical protein
MLKSSNFSNVVVTNVSARDQILSQLTALNASQYKHMMATIRKGIRHDDQLAIDSAIELHCFNQMVK